MIPEYRKISNAIWVVNTNGWVMCYNMMDCYVIYWRVGFWGKGLLRKKKDIVNR